MMDNISDNFGKLPWNEKLKILRAMKGWTQEEAAEQCCTHKKVYWLWEKGKSNPRKGTKKLISNAFGVDEKFLFN